MATRPLPAPFDRDEPSSLQPSTEVPCGQARKSTRADPLDLGGSGLLTSVEASEREAVLAGKEGQRPELAQGDAGHDAVLMLPQDFLYGLGSRRQQLRPPPHHRPRALRGVPQASGSLANLVEQSRP
jgi:hypothetical protein